MNPAPIRAFSIIAHTGCSIQVFFLSMMVTDNDRLVSLMSCLFFATHPVHVEAVIGVINLSEPMCCLLYLTTIITYIHTSKEQRISLQIISTLFSFILIFTSTLLKEIGITVVGVIFVLVFLKLLHSNPSLPSSVDVLYILISMLALFIYIVLRKLMSAIDIVDFILIKSKLGAHDMWQLLIKSGIYLDHSDLIRNAENPFSFLEGKEKILSYIYLHWRYLYLLLVPWNLCAEYAFNCIPSICTFADSRIFLPLVMYIGLFFVISFSLYRLYKYRCDQCVLVFVALMIVPFLPASGIIKLGTLLAERLLYIPSVGFCMMLSYSLKMLCSIGGGRLGYFVISFIIVCLYSYRVITRNPAWKNDKTLYLESLKVCPDSAKLNLQLSKMYLNEGNVTLSKKYLNFSKSIDRRFCDVGYEEALISLVEGNIERSEELALENLSCPYTSMYSFQILNKIWLQRLRHFGHKNVEVLEDIASKCESYGLFAAAVQRYMLASQASLDFKSFSKALDLCEKAESVYLKLSNNTKIEDSEEFQQLVCFLYAYTGKLRYVARGEQGVEQYGFESITPYLLKSIHSSCSRLYTADSELGLSGDSISSIHILSAMYEDKYRAIDEAHLWNSTTISFLHEYSSILQSSMSSLLNIINSLETVSSVNSRLNVKSYRDIVNYFVIVSENFKLISGTLAQMKFITGINDESRDIYEGIATHQEILQDLINREQILEVFYNDEHWKRTQQGQMNSLSCSMYQWYAHSVAGSNKAYTSNVKYNEKKILRIIDLLQFAMKKCHYEVEKNAQALYRHEQQKMEVMSNRNILDMSEFLEGD